MRTKKQKLSAEEIVNFFQQKPTFDKSQKDSSIKYGWPSTRGGLYIISDMISWFAERGYDRKALDDALYNFFQKQDIFLSKPSKMEKGKTHNIYLIRVFNHNPDYKSSFVYYFYDITPEQALKLKNEYEAESLALMQPFIEKRKLIKKNASAAKKVKEEKKVIAKANKTTRVKKEALIET